MRYRRLDENWDYTFGRGAQNYLTGIDAVAQAIRSRLLLLYREWWEDQEDGLPLWEQVLGTSGSDDNLRSVDIIFRDRISGTTGVVAVLEYESEFKNRVYIFRATVETLYGDLYISNSEEAKA